MDWETYGCSGCGGCKVAENPYVLTDIAMVLKRRREGGGKKSPVSLILFSRLPYLCVSLSLGSRPLSCSCHLQVNLTDQKPGLGINNNLVKMYIIITF